jgi:hypothetical protein
MDRIPAKPGNRESNLKGALVKLKASARQEAAYFDSPANTASFKAERRKNAADEKFCWK